MPLNFQNPSILWGLISLIIPIIIHLFNFKRFKSIYFSNLKFLKNVTAENKNKSKIKNWILLLTRLLALTALILAFAQPYIPEQNNSSVNKKQRNITHVYVDNSFSMNAETDKGIAIEIAKSKAIELVHSLSDETQIKIIDNENKGQLPFLDKERAITKLQEIRPTSESKVFSQIIKEADLDQTKRNNRLYLFSDFQKYQADFNRMSSTNKLEVSLMPLTTQSKNNLYIDSCWFKQTAHQIDQNEELQVRIHNSSNKAFRKIPIKLYINDSLKTVSSFNIPAQEKLELRLHFKNHKPGIYSGRIEISDYPITYDNTMFFSYDIQKNAEIICINQEKENRYISQLFSDEVYFNLQNITKSQFHQVDLNQIKLVILNQLADMKSGFRQKIAHYLNQGGQILILPENGTNTSNNELLSELGASQFTEIDSLTRTVSEIEQSADIYKEVFDKLKTNARLPQIYRHFKLSDAEKTIQVSLWKSKSGENLFTQTKIGLGKLFISSFQFDPKWTNAIKHPIFIPSLINIALNNKSHSPLYYTLNSEEFAIPNALNSNREKNLFHIKNKTLGIDLIPEQINHFDKGLLLNTHKQIKEAGNYFITQSEQNIAGISFNYARQESNLEFYNSPKIKDLIKKYNLKYQLFNLNTTDLKNMLRAQENGNSYWRFFLILAFIFLIFEILVQKLKYFN